jgi:dGTPase
MLDERLYEEGPPSTRSEARRDRDRVLYSSALLRLGHVTQVAAPEIGHTFHSRLTHSLKVAQVGGGVVQRLIKLAANHELDKPSTALVASLDEHAVEAAALAHDLGHPPFGHLAEEVLQEKAKQADFEGNPQSFRIVTRLALRDLRPGLNLTRRTLNGLLKYPWLRDPEHEKRAEKWGAYEGDARYFHWAREGIPEGERTLEAELMDWADDVTYAVHDMDDFYRAGLIPLDRLHADPEERELLYSHLAAEYPNRSEELKAAGERLFGGFMWPFQRPFSGSTDARVTLRKLGSDLIARYIAAVKLCGDDDGRVIFDISDDIRDEVTVMKALTWLYIIKRPSLAVMQRGHGHIIETLYDLYEGSVSGGDLDLLPPAFRERVPQAKTPGAQQRIVIDMIAGMTEASATAIYRQSLGVAAGSLLMRAAGPA